MEITHKLMLDVFMCGSKKSTRSGEVISVFKRDIYHDMRTGFPAPNSKKLMFNAMIGELLWFANGKSDLDSLRKYSCLSPEAWTIWSDDCKRWGRDDIGKSYGYAWRSGIDQLQRLVDNMVNNPLSRYLIVQSYIPEDVAAGAMALPPCHTGFQVYVDGEYFDLDWTQRSVDVFLGLPFNIASYAALMCILGSITGLKPRHLYGSLKDVHIYTAHEKAVLEQLSRPVAEVFPTLLLPEIKSLSDLENLTARDFRLDVYNPMPAIKAPLLVG